VGLKLAHNVCKRKLLHTQQALNRVWHTERSATKASAVDEMVPRRACVIEGDMNGISLR
jgi:hypothetical protein